MERWPGVLEAQEEFSVSNGDWRWGRLTILNDRKKQGLENLGVRVIGYRKVNRGDAFQKRNSLIQAKVSQ